MRKPRSVTAIALILTLALTPMTDACTRILYEDGAKNYLVGRTMDWMEDVHSDLWAFPKGMKRDGGLGAGSIEWTSNYGSVIVSFYGLAAADGMNEAGLVANLLYLSEADYGTDAKADKPTLSIGAWVQFVLDEYGTVAEAVEGLRAEPFRIVAPSLPSGEAASAHLAISDASGDSAIFEYVEGNLTIHHGSQYQVMTNSPTYDKQLAIDAYWAEIGGEAMLPGTSRAADRFVRASFYLASSPKFSEPRLAISSVFSMIRAVSVPLGIKDPEKPNIATTLWRTVSDPSARRYYFDSAVSPDVFWVDLDELDLSEGAPALRLDLQDHPILAGETSKQFREAKPFPWLAP